MINYYDLLFDKCFICDTPAVVTSPNSFDHICDDHSFHCEKMKFGSIFELSFLNSQNKNEKYYILISAAQYRIELNEKLIYRLDRGFEIDFGVFTVPNLKSIQDIENFIILM